MPILPLVISHATEDDSKDYDQFLTEMEDAFDVKQPRDSEAEPETSTEQPQKSSDLDSCDDPDSGDDPDSNDTHELQEKKVEYC